MLTGVTTIASVLATLVNPAIGQWEHARYLRPVVYVLLLAVLYGFACLLLNWKKRDWFHDHSAMLAMAFFNCAAYGAMALTVYSGFNWLEAAAFGFGNRPFLSSGCIFAGARKALHEHLQYSQSVSGVAGRVGLCRADFTFFIWPGGTPVGRVGQNME